MGMTETLAQLTTLLNSIPGIDTVLERYLLESNKSRGNTFATIDVLDLDPLDFQGQQSFWATFEIGIYSRGRSIVTPSDALITGLINAELVIDTTQIRMSHADVDEFENANIFTVPILVTYDYR